MTSKFPPISCVYHVRKKVEEKRWGTCESVLGRGDVVITESKKTTNRVKEIERDAGTRDMSSEKQTHRNMEARFCPKERETH